MSISIERLQEIHSNEKIRSNGLLHEGISEEGRLLTDPTLATDLSKSIARVDLLEALIQEANLPTSIPSETTSQEP